MAIPAGTRLGPYEVLSALGAGGMGEVYRARDVRLDRIVAIKILPSADADLKARFAREARAIAALAHPHICVLYDVGQQNGTDYLVMEYLEGETLAARLQRAPLQFHEALGHARDIADALNKAHRTGVIHRDLKPANIMLTRDGAKLLDFGVAKLRPSAVGVTGGMVTVTEPTALTAFGTVGTPQYMAPEQLEGKEADERSDLFAFGEVLYEMVTGRRAFQATTPAGLIAAIMSAEPELAELQEVSSPAFAYLVKTCLTKDPVERRQTAQDVVLELQRIAENQGDVTEPLRRARGPGWTLLVAASIVLLSVSLGVIGYFATNERLPRPVRVSLPLPDPEPFESNAAISPDGGRVAFTGRDSAGRLLLWIRPLESSTSVPIEGTEGALDPFWSPDGRFIGFFAQKKMKIVGADVGSVPPAVQILADAPDPRGGTWSSEGVIVFARNIEDGLYRVPASGGDVTAITTLDRSKRENSHRWPQFLPGDRRLLYLSRSAAREHQGIYVGTPGTQDWKLLLRTPLGAMVTSVQTGTRRVWPFSAAQSFLLFMREQTVMAQPLNLQRLELSGEASPVAESVAVAINRGFFSASENSTLAYRSMTDHQLKPVWFDRAGKRLSTALSASGSDPRLSPDGRYVALGRIDPASGAGDIWIEDLSRGVPTRFTSHPGYEWIPIWSPDGSQLAFASNRDGMMDLYGKSVSGSEPERLLLKSDARKVPTDWSRDGGHLLFQQEDTKNGWDVWALSISAERKAFPVLQSEFNEFQGVLSPNGQWLAYTSDETGANQVYVQPFTGGRADGRTPSRAQGKSRVSPEGGSQPHWRSDGKELFYLSPDQVVAVSIEPGPPFVAGAATPLFSARIIDSLSPQYDVSADGNRFLIMTTAEERRPPGLTLYLNWTSALNRVTR